MGPAQKEGQTMTEQEQERVFGLQPRPKPTAGLIGKKKYTGLLRRAVVSSWATATTGATKTSALRISGSESESAWSPVPIRSEVSFREPIAHAPAADGDGEQLDGEGDAEVDIAAAAEPAVEPEDAEVDNFVIELTPDPPAGAVDDGPTDMEI